MKRTKHRITDKYSTWGKLIKVNTPLEKSVARRNAALPLRWPERAVVIDKAYYKVLNEAARNSPYDNITHLLDEILCFALYGDYSCIKDKPMFYHFLKRSVKRTTKAPTKSSKTSPSSKRRATSKATDSLTVK